jgi:hypothetical protein
VQQYGAVYQSVIVPPGVTAPPRKWKPLTSPAWGWPRPIYLILLPKASWTCCWNGLANLFPARRWGAQYLSASFAHLHLRIPLHPGAVAAYRTHHG